MPDLILHFTSVKLLKGECWHCFHCPVSLLYRNKMSSTEPTILEKAMSLATSMRQSDSVAKETSATLAHQNQTKTHTRHAARSTKKNARKTAQMTKIAAKSISGSVESAEEKIARTVKKKARCIFDDAKVAAMHKIKQMRDTFQMGKKRWQDGAQEAAGLAQSANEVNKAGAATARTEALIGDAKKAWKESYHYLKDTLKWAATQSKRGAAGSAGMKCLRWNRRKTQNSQKMP